MAKLIIPTPLRKFTDNQASITLEGNTVGDAIQGLVQQYPDLKQHLLDKDGNLRQYVNVFVGDEDIRSLQREGTPVQQDSTVSIVPAIAGG
jgi:molybdopterin converting factor small subunit